MRKTVEVLVLEVPTNLKHAHIECRTALRKLAFSYRKTRPELCFLLRQMSMSISEQSIDVEVNLKESKG